MTSAVKGLVPASSQARGVARISVFSWIPEAASLGMTLNRAMLKVHQHSPGYCLQHLPWDNCKKCTSVTDCHPMVPESCQVPEEP